MAIFSPGKEKDKWLMVKTVQDRLNVSDNFVYRLIRDGKLKALRHGPRMYRISEKSLNAYIDASVVDPEDFFK